jgi:hypothetical protein
MAVFPGGIFNWTDRVNYEDIDWAQDPNSLAADLIAVEKTLGVLPQQLANPNAGAPITFANVAQLLDYLASGAQIPVVEIQSAAQLVPNRQGSSTHYGAYNSYTTSIYDPFALSNGTDVTAPVTGWYTVDAGEFWDWNASGYNAAHLWVGAGLKATNRWDWAFQGNTQGGYWQAESNVGRPGYTGIHWAGVVNQGQRISVISENGTSNQLATVRNLQLSIALTRLTPSDTQLLPAAHNTPTSGSPPPQVSRYPAPSGLSLAPSYGGGGITVQWNSLTSPTPVPPAYAVAVYDVANNSLASYQTLVPFAAGLQTDTTPVLPIGGYTYQVHVWALGGLLQPPHAVKSISL